MEEGKFVDRTCEHVTVTAKDIHIQERLSSFVRSSSSGSVNVCYLFYSYYYYIEKISWYLFLIIIYLLLNLWIENLRAATCEKSVTLWRIKDFSLIPTIKEERKNFTLKHFLRRFLDTKIYCRVRDAPQFISWQSCNPLLKSEECLQIIYVVSVL